IYTRTGDDGTTGLIGGGRVVKHDARLECYGTVDELNAVIGLATVTATAPARAKLQQVQSELFVIGSHLAAPEDDAATTHALPPQDPAAVTRLEKEIDEADAVLPALANFILPGGTDTAARLHHARTVCRRTERLITAYAQQRAAHGRTVTYLNRLSDWLFVQARLANHEAGVADVSWTPAKP
ncbi:MAG TPA: cob(I)yrinic acid a,c-diamide adenosyltransferase, partial [Tepidisphaeraceae bacterium]